MVKQQVNLLDALPKRLKVELPLKWVGLIILGVLIFFVLLSLYFGGRAIWLSQHHSALQKQVDTKLEMLKRLSKNVSGGARLNKNVDELKQELKERQAYYQNITSEALSESKSFAPYLTALAQHVLPGVWLTKITVNNPLNTVKLEGKGYLPERILSYANALNQTAAFKTKPLMVSSIDREKAGKNTLTFELSSKGALK